MTPERELEISKWLKLQKTGLKIQPSQYWDLLKLIDDYHQEHLRLNIWQRLKKRLSILVRNFIKVK